MPSLDFTNHVVSQNFSKEIETAFLDALPVRDLIGGRSSVIFRPADTDGTTGASTTIQLRDRFGGTTKTGNVDTRITGSPSPNYYPDVVKLGDVYTSYDEGASRRSLNAQSVPVDLAQGAKDQVADDMAIWFSRAVFAQLGGVAIQGVDGFNTLSAPSYVVPVTNILDGIVQAIKIARDNAMNPASGLAPGCQWVLYMNQAEVAALRQYKDPSKNTWFDLASIVQQANNSGRQFSQDIIGSCYGVELRSNYYCPAGTMYLMGSQAMVASFAKGFDTDNHVQTITEINDGTIFHVKAWSVCGIKKTQFKGKDFGVVALKLSSAKVAA